MFTARSIDSIDDIEVAYAQIWDLVRAHRFSGARQAIAALQARLDERAKADPFYPPPKFHSAALRRLRETIRRDEVRQVVRTRPAAVVAAD